MLARMGDGAIQMVFAQSAGNHLRGHAGAAELFTQSVGENRFRHDATRSLYPEMEQVSAVQSRRILS
jgi:hypothetical protein